MKIIIVNDYAYVQGGAAQVAITSARGLAEAGYKVVYVFGVGPAEKLLLHPNIELVDFMQFDLLSNPSRISAAVSGLWNRDVEHKMHSLLSSFDRSNTVIHIHSWVKSLSGSVVSVALDNKFSVVLTLHDYFTVCPNGGFYNFQSNSICQLKPLSLPCLTSNCDLRSYSQKIWRYMRQNFYSHAGIPSRIKNYIYISNFSKSVLQELLPKSALLWDIPNPIDVPRDTGSSILNPENKFSFVGRLSTEKGAVLMAQACAKYNLECRFVGDGDLKEELQIINPDAQFVGWVGRTDVFRYIQNSCALVLPSQWYETQGLVVAEAAAIGVPSIVSDVCAAKDFIIDGETGLLFESGNLESLACKMKLLSDNSDLAKKLGRQAYENYWSKPLNMKNHLDKLLSCYKNIIE